MGQAERRVALRELCLYLVEASPYEFHREDEVIGATGIEPNTLLAILATWTHHGLVTREGGIFQVTLDGFSWISSVATYALLVQLREQTTAQVAEILDLVLKIAEDQRLL